MHPYLEEESIRRNGLCVPAEGLRGSHQALLHCGNKTPGRGRLHVILGQLRAGMRQG